MGDEKKCYELDFVCHNTKCRYWEKMTPEGERLYGNCTLRVANEGPHTLGEISTILGVTKERVRQLEAQALRRLAFQATKRGLDSALEEFITEFYGDVTRWPPGAHSTHSGRRTEEDEMAYIRVGNDIFLEFVKDKYKSALSKKIACARASCMVNLAACMLCRYRSKCIFVDEKWRNADPSEFFIENITNIDALVESCRTGRARKASKAQKILEVYRE
ncbi:MAG: hypothetical protein DRN14_05055, partial [Thermoplasmata archaeon]